MKLPWILRVFVKLVVQGNRWRITILIVYQVKQGDGDQLVVTQKRRQTHQQLQRKIHQRQQQKQQNNGHPAVPQSPVAMVTQPHAVIPHSQAKTQVRSIKCSGHIIVF